MEKFLSASKTGEALIEGTSFKKYITKGSPVLLISTRKAIENYKNMLFLAREVFEDCNIKVEFYYSVKTNSDLRLIRALNESGMGMEIVSELELEQLLENGIEPCNIILGGLGKNRELMKKACDLGVKQLYLDSLEEMEIINKLEMAPEQIPDLGIILRCHSNSKIGFNADLTRALNGFKYKERIKALHYHCGTQIANNDFHVNRIEKLIDLTLSLEDSTGVSIKYLNIGGGFPEANILKKVKLRSIFSNLANKMKVLFKDRDRKQITIQFEPGRYIVGDAGILIAEIISIKHDLINDYIDPWIFINAGMNVVTNFSKARNRYMIAEHMNASYNKPFNIAGLVPSNVDVHVKHYPLPESTRTSEHVIITNMGAYTLPFLNDFCMKRPRVVII
ncbi:MAG: hypothetical protein ACTSVI_15885 [Promethearchaeota archaeon]